MGGNGYQLLLAMPHGAMGFGSDGEVLAINLAAEQILGTTVSEMTAEVEPQYYWVHADGKTRYPGGTEPWNRVLQTGVTIIGEQMGFCRPSDVLCRWVSVNAMTFPAKLEHPEIKVVCSFQDVTAQILLQEQLRKALEQRQESLDLVQGALRPAKLKISEGWRIAETNIPAVPDTQVCGDVYDSFCSKDGKRGVMLADVSGKGLESADFSVLAKNTIHAYGYATSLADRVFCLTNAVLCDHLEESGEDGKFVTAVLLMIDLLSGEFDLVNAGHEPVAVYQADGNVAFLSDGELPLGLFPDTCYCSRSNLLQKGGKIVLYTDGLTDARNPDGEMFGIIQLERCLKAFGNLEAKELLEKLVWYVREWSQSRVSDDLTIVIIERLQD